MSLIKIGIVEDEIIIADDMLSLLQSLGYQVPEPCGNYDEAIAMMQNEQPDLVILDINLGGKKDGIDVGKYIRNNLNIPFIYLTANSDKATIERARETHPDAYLVKPFDKADLYSAIEIALYNFNNQKKITPQKNNTSPVLRTSIFIKDGEYFHKVNFDDIIYLESEHVYITIHTMKRKFLVRSTMQEYLENLDPAKFFRVHRSYVINLDKIDKINTGNIIVGGAEIPISKNYRDDLLKMLNIS